jgi:argininosuccinate synthase
MRNLDIADSRAKLEQYAALGMVGSGGGERAAIGAAQAAATGLIGALSQGGAEAIASRGAPAGDDEWLDRAAMEAGND